MGDVLEKLMAKREREAREKTKKAIRRTRRDFAKNMLADAENIEKVAKYSKLSLKEVSALAKKLSA